MNNNMKVRDVLKLVEKDCGICLIKDGKYVTSGCGNNSEELLSKNIELDSEVIKIKPCEIGMDSSLELYTL